MNEYYYFLINPAYTTISSSIKLLLTRTIGPSCYFINSRLLKQELFSAINKSIRLWPCGPIRLRDLSTRLCLLDVMVWDQGKCRPTKCNAAIDQWRNQSERATWSNDQPAAESAKR